MKNFKGGIQQEEAVIAAMTPVITALLSFFDDFI